ncbi:MAG: head-tail connector protein [Pseudomonadota bacterium]
MALVPLNGPALEPLDLARVKAHLRVDSNDEDALISSLIITSRLHIEAALGLAMLTQRWAHVRDCWPKDNAMTLPLRPLQRVDEVVVFDGDDQPTTIDPAHYVVDTVGQPPRLMLRRGGAAPEPGRVLNGIEVRFTAGYGDDAEAVPLPVRQALMLLVAHWYENREPVEIGTSSVSIPRMVNELLLPYRSRRL